MSFGGGSGGSNSLSGATDVFLSNVINGQVLGYDGTIAKWKNTSASGSTSSWPGIVYFDEFFSGATDNEKITAMNTWARNQQTQGSMPAVVFATRVYTISTPIKLFSGLKLIGGDMSVARFAGPGTTIKWQGASGSSLFIFPPEGQSLQSYPADGSPRDIGVYYLNLSGTSTTHVFPKLLVDGSDYTGKTIWFSTFYSLRIVNFATVWWGYGDGVCWAGFTDIGALSDVAFCVAGAENRMFGSDFYSQCNVNSENGKPFMISRMGKSYIGNVMFTARKSSYQLLIDGGNNLVVDGLALDAQSSDPVYGAGLQINGGECITITNCSFKGMATNPSSGAGGASRNRGWIDVNGGDQITFTNNNFLRQGNNMPATSYPLLYASASLPAGAVRWGYNNYGSFGTAVVQLTQGAPGKIVAQTDPRVNINS